MVDSSRFCPRPIKTPKSKLIKVNVLRKNSKSTTSAPSKASDDTLPPEAPAAAPPGAPAPDASESTEGTAPPVPEQPAAPSLGTTVVNIVANILQHQGARTVVAGFVDMGLKALFERMAHARFREEQAKKAAEQPSKPARKPRKDALRKARKAKPVRTNKP